MKRIQLKRKKMTRKSQSQSLRSQTSRKRSRLRTKEERLQSRWYIRLILKSNTQNKQDPSCATYSFIEEDHTLGNSLRYLLMANTNTSFCGYTIPHPSESVMNLRLQTNGAKANDVIKGSLKDLATLCDILSENYERALEEFKQKSKK
eukprot:TRINITY_DN2496_c0_g1_i2.p1 TRINITY_DN2496_c0_g1~~TRINITY_DN2496_c0_g1_i2.p1  ORF type:complete len:148 (+),score=34.87 TRINITY_DN2496_c0_g1_i2:156-599(+)